jgi:protein-disulfide isomerase
MKRRQFGLGNQGDATLKQTRPVWFFGLDSTGTPAKMHTCPSIMMDFKQERPAVMTLKRLIKFTMFPALAAGFVFSGSLALAADSDAAFKVAGKVTTMKDVKKANEGEFFEIEKRRFGLIEQAAREAYLEYYWEKLAKGSGKSVAAAKAEYFEKNAKVSGGDVKSTLEQFKDHPQLSKMPKAEQEKQVKEYLKSRKEEEAIEKILDAARKSKELVILATAPKEPVFSITVSGKDHVRYAQIKDGTDPTAPAGCSGDACPVTIVEYSEFQCPFCARTLPTAEQVMAEYKGKVRWVVRDFPLNFHERAKPAAIAASCAGQQNKYWQMYKVLFENQRKLGDADLEAHAKVAGVDMKRWKECVKDPKGLEQQIDANVKSGMSVGVNGTPAFFINGRKLSGAMAYPEFRRIIEDELNNKKSH